jgi:COP9 signalosome complex subunit 6
VQLAASAAAVRGLGERLETLEAYVEGVRAGSAPANHALLREIAAVVGRMPVADAASFRRDMATDVSDSLLLSYAAAVTKGAASLASLTAKLRVTAAEKEREARSNAMAMGGGGMGGGMGGGVALGMMMGMGFGPGGAGGGGGGGMGGGGGARQRPGRGHH